MFRKNGCHVTHPRTPILILIFWRMYGVVHSSALALCTPDENDNSALMLITFFLGPGGSANQLLVHLFYTCTILDPV